MINLILKKLSEEAASAKGIFNDTGARAFPRHFYIDNLLPEALAKEIFNSFPDVQMMRKMNSFREKKFTSKSFDKFKPLMSEITFAFQRKEVVQKVQEITGIVDQVPDPTLYAGGISAMGLGHHLGPHIDNSHDSSGKLYRTLNLLYYITPDWLPEYGGNLELWDRKVKNRITVVSKFNRLVVMETNPLAWHSVSEVKTDRLRCCVSNYYFSTRSPTGINYSNVTSFSARPEQHVRRAVAWVDRNARQAVRWLAPKGLGKKDVYEGPTK